MTEFRAATEEEIPRLRRYARTLTRNGSLNWVRSAMREGITVDIEEQSSNLVATTDPTVARQLHELDRALTQVPEEQRKVILLVGLEGMSYEDAAAILHIPVGTVRSRLSRGRDALRTLMGMGERTLKPGPNSPLPKETAITAVVLVAGKRRPDWNRISTK